MDPLIEDNRAALAALCEAYGVERLEVFGSAASGRFDPAASDLDFLVRFRSCSPSEHYERYFGLLEALGELFGRPIDLVEIDALRNPYMIRRVNQSRKPVYAA